MAIILEGMDGTGKSTLSKKFGLAVIHPGAPPKQQSLETAFFKEQQMNAGRPLVYDRVTCISQQVYRKRMFDAWYMVHLQKLVATPHCIIVHCRPPDEVVLNIDNHTVSDHDTPEMLKLVRDNAATFMHSYDRLMQSIPHVVYDFTKTNLDDFLAEIVPTQYHLKEWKECNKKLKAMRSFS